MARKKKMMVSDEELVSMIALERSNVEQDGLDRLSEQRVEANKSFANQLTLGTRPSTNMSAMKFYYTPSVVNTLTMHQSKVFCSGKDTVHFTPSNPEETVQMAAKQLSGMVNTVLHRENPGFEVITEMFRSAGVNKNSVAKVIWDEEKEIFEEQYDNISPDILAQIVFQKESEGFEVEVVAEEVLKESVVETVIDEISGEELEVSVSDAVYSYVVRYTKMRGKVKVSVLPPEEFLINEDTTSINNDDLTRFVAHRRDMYKGDAMEMFPDASEDDFVISDSVLYDWEREARHSVDGTFENYDANTGGYDKTTRVDIAECWIRADRDGDGYPEWRHVFVSGNNLLSDEEWFGSLPFASYTFFPIPHKFYGLSVYDRLQSYEETATALIRSDVDMARLKNTFRIFAKDGNVDRRALQSGKPGVIPVAQSFSPDDVMVVPTPNGSGNVSQMLDQLERQVTGEIGIDRITGQISQDIEKSGNDAEKTAMAIDNATVKVEGYSRRFAEGPLRDICWMIALELVRHKDDPFVQDIVNSVTPGEPFYAADLGFHNILRKTDLASRVGLGHQSGTQKIAAVGAIMPLLDKLTANPTKANYNLIKESLIGFGYENPEEILGPVEYYKEKSEQQQQLAQSQLMQSQAQQQQLQIQAQQAQQQMQIEQARFDFEKELKLSESQAKASLDEAKAREAIAQARKVEAEALLAERMAAGELPVPETKATVSI